MTWTTFRSAAFRFAAVGLLASTCGLRAQQPHSLAQTAIAADAALGQRLASRSAVSLAVADVNSDGTPDLITGYRTGSTGALLLQAGDGHALAPTSAQLAAMASGQTVAPFADAAKAIDLPVRPDLLKAADLRGHGHIDLVVAAKGDSTAYLLAGDGAGGFAQARALPLAGAASALTVWRGPGGTQILAAAVCGASGCGVQMMAADGTTEAFVATSSAVTRLESAALNGGRYPDLVALTSDNVLVLDGASLLSGAPETSTLPISGGAAIASGLFAYDRRGFAQVAVLGSNATLHVFARAGVDSTAATRAEVQAQRKASALKLAKTTVHPSGLAWTEVETVYGVGSGGASAMMLRGRLSGGGYDDLAVLSGGQSVTVSHPLSRNDAGLVTTPTVTSGAISSTATAAVAARLTPDARLSVITASAAAASPSYTIPTVFRTLLVTTTSDATPTTAATTACRNGASGCTLRAAIAVANADVSSTGQSRVDQINLPAGTYTLSATNGSTYDNEGSFNYHLDVDSSVNFVGSGTASTIINANQIDKVFSVDSGVVNPLAPFDVFFSNLTIENGENKNNEESSECAESCNFYGGNIDYESYGPGTLGFSNVSLTGGTILYGIGQGGGLFVSNSNSSGAANGLTEFDTSTISGNKAPNQGGGLAITQYVPLTLNTDTFSGNIASPSVSPNAPELASYTGDGGAVWIDSAGAPTISITGTTFSNNTAKNEGGALWVGEAGPTITGSTFTGNSGGSFGGGAYIQNLSTPVSITTSTFTSNLLTGTSGQSYAFPANGAGVCVDTNVSGDEQVTIHYSRFHGNTGGTSTGLGVGCAFSNTNGDGYAMVNATDNWWGCNGPAVGTGCDTAASRYPSTATLALTPYTTLTLALSATSLTEGATITATGSLGQDSSGTVYSAANDLAYDGIQASLTLTDVSATTTSGSTLSATANTAISYAAITAQGTTNATGTGTATLTVDGASLSRTYTITAPDLTVTSTHGGNFKAGDAADVYTLVATNSGNGTTSGTVTVTDTLPAGFTAHSLSGSGWTCTLATLTCTRADALSGGSNYPPITLSVSIAASDAGTYTNTVRVSGGGETNTSNDSGSDSTNVVGAPTIAEAFAPASVAVGVNSTVTFTLGNPSANPVSLTVVAFTDALPSGLNVATPSGATSTCSAATVSAVAGGSSISLSGATLAAGATCTVSVNVNSASGGSYTNTTGTVTATNSNAGSTASATLTVTQPSTDSVTVTSTSITYGTATTTLSATVSFTGSAAPTGGLTFSVNGGTAVAATCSGSASPLTCTASYPTGSLGVGSYTILATEAADTHYTAASGTGTLTVTAAANGTPSLTASSTQTLQADGSYLVTVTVSNTGNGVAQGVTLTAVSFGSATGSPAPQSLGTIQPGNAVTTTVSVPSSAGTPGQMVIERLGGTFTGGSFTNTYRATLP